MNGWKFAPDTNQSLKEAFSLTRCRRRVLAKAAFKVVKANFQVFHLAYDRLENSATCIFLSSRSFCGTTTLYLSVCIIGMPSVVYFPKIEETVTNFEQNYAPLCDI
jgi:hypothetical protein